ncbi:MAG: hypothetical protein QOG89_242, partial [Thermomicrobiales bacterium]|nr:hypothetical protein [Thermomicrobiales bacterium]
LEMGVHPKVVSEMLGHQKIQTTLDLYSHVSESLQRSAADALDAGMFADAPDDDEEEHATTTAAD